MIAFNQNREELITKGFSITENIFSNEEVDGLITLIGVSDEKYAIRQLVNKKPEILKVILNNRRFKQLYKLVCKENYFLTKAIFFNKPSKSNWFVSNHQDLSISAKNKKEANEYTNWTNKKGQLGVIPPVNILEQTITFRIHLDKADETNGALRVISKTHKKGVIRIDEKFNNEGLGKDELCVVSKGGVMMMKPLLLHSSSKSISENDRRVIHLEFCNQEIPMGWLEKIE
jgi:ectoine hydroxylase-related dioxygenase (phytanoyl-CoA dioxygenase family)